MGHSFLRSARSVSGTFSFLFARARRVASFRAYGAGLWPFFFFFFIIGRKPENQMAEGPPRSGGMVSPTPLSASCPKCRRHRATVQAPKFEDRRPGSRKSVAQI